MRFINHTAAILILILVFSVPCYSSMQLEVDVTEHEESTGKSLRIFIDSVRVHPDDETHLFAGALTISIFTEDQFKTSIMSQIEIASTQSNRKLKSYEQLLKVGDPFSASLDGKNDSHYSIEIIPLSIDNRHAPDIETQLNADESIHLIYHYPPQSIVEYKLPYYSAFIETALKALKEDFQIAFPGKVNYFLFERESGNLLWDDDFPIAFNPMQRKMAVVYDYANTELCATYLSAYLIYEQWGFSHPFLVWGFAGYFDAPHFFTMKLRSTGIKIDPADFFTSRLNWQGNPAHYLPYIASFVHYCVRTYGINEFKELYNTCSDITDLKSSFKTHFGESYETIKDDWLRMLDGYDPDLAEVGFYADNQYNFLNNYDRAGIIFEYLAKKYPKNSGTAIRLGGCLYGLGDYDRAADIYNKLTKLKGDEAESYLLLGNSLYSDGKYKKAKRNYLKAIELDSTYYQAYYKLATIFLKEEQYQQAEENFMMALGWAPEGSIYSQIYLGWAESFEALNQSRKADSLRNLGVAFAENRVEAIPHVLMNRMLLGEAYLAVNKPRIAIDELLAAIEYEKRAYYIGRINLGLGKAYDLLNQRNKAEQFYRKVIEGKSAAYHKEQARQLIKQPYRRS
ncbi:MAG: tetratricopeptide repeat protein [candidate division Zixibacteria bacterium]|nr:tetratricopeptide repeat protein [candidate division Zixibacteria bacterium]